jgi:hypothetical protein
LVRAPGGFETRSISPGDYINALGAFYILLMFPSVAKGRLVNAMKEKRMDGDLIRWTHSFLSERTVEMVLEDKAMKRQPVEAGVPQGSPVSPILFAIYTAGLIKNVERMGVEGLSFVDNLGWIATGKAVNEVVRRLEACAADSLEWAANIRHCKNRSGTFHAQNFVW